MFGCYSSILTTDMVLGTILLLVGMILLKRSTLLQELLIVTGLLMADHENGPLFTIMSRTRASFKLALRYCRDHEEMMRADACAKNLADRDFRSFWQNVNKYNNGNCTKYVGLSTVGGCTTTTTTI